MKSQTFKKLQPDLEAMTEQKIIQLIQENPSIMVRPILASDQQMMVGFKEADYEAFLTESTN